MHVCVCVWVGGECTRVVGACMSVCLGEGAHVMTNIGTRTTKGISTRDFKEETLLNQSNIGMMLSSVRHSPERLPNQ